MDQIDIYDQGTFIDSESFMTGDREILNSVVERYEAMGFEVRVTYFKPKEEAA